MTAKLEFVIRQTNNHIIIAGTMVTSDYKVGSLAGMEMYASKIDDNSFRVFIKKEQFIPKDPYNEQFEKHSLSELPMCNIWRGFKSENPCEFGGVIMARDNQLFSNESPDRVSRLALMSVLQDSSNILDIDQHAAFRSGEHFESEQWHSFIMKRDTSEGTAGLLESLKGDSITGFYRKPFWTLADGTSYRLQATTTLYQHQLYGKQARELAELGVISEETKQKMREQWLNINKESGYVDFLKALYEKCPVASEQFERLLTEDEHKAIEAASEDILREMMD